ncbi:unnamed protein product [Echinostoma caproni]|uniref:RRM domain-containing protein n=1 Tax=Echinostoma caproni TaxID=27848 RepID=A0A183AFY0_9TREM|nr:unnamed protein product [Echinostoma caproni]
MWIALSVAVGRIRQLFIRLLSRYGSRRHFFLSLSICLNTELEKQEAKARAERERQRQASATSAMADHLRREWQHRTEQIELQARLERKRQNEEQLKQAEEWESKMSRLSDCLVRVKWNPSENPEVSAMYTKDFLVTCLSEHGDVVTIMVGKRGTAMVEFSSLSDAKTAVAASEQGAVGLPSLPLKLSLVEQNHGPEPGQFVSEHSEQDKSPFPARNTSSVRM